MGNVLSEEELQELKSQAEEINPGCLAKVIRHAIHREGKHVPDEFGIHFAEDPDEGAIPTVYVLLAG